jgi:hypothetical protein
MAKKQFLVLYRQFLFRMVDPELLSAGAQGDMSKLFGQFASLLVANPAKRHTLSVQCCTDYGIILPVKDYSKLTRSQLID